MLQLTQMDDFNTSILVSSPLTEPDQARAIVAQYSSYFIALPPHQNVHVRVDPSALIRWEQMVHVYTSIRRFHQKHKLIDSVNLYIADKITVKWFRCLTCLFSSSVKINIVEEKEHASKKICPKAMA